MLPKTVRLFIKPFCGWCHEVMEWLDAHHVEHERLNVTADEAAFREMVELSGQSRAPVIEVDGEVLADFGADELEAWWRKRGYPMS